MSCRNKRGGAITFGVVLALALIVLGIGFVVLSMIMGGQRETKNATDAGALNAAKLALDSVAFNLSNAPEQQFYKDVLSDGVANNGQVNLRTINNVWGKCLLVAINADAAQNGPNNNVGTGNDSVSSAFQGATEISNTLADKLNKASNLYGFFNNVSSLNSVRMLGTKASVSPKEDSSWQTSTMDQGVESNIVLNGDPSNNFNLPPGTGFNQQYATQTTRPQAPDALSQGAWFIKGYTQIPVGGATIWTVPFQYGETPHLVSSNLFQQDQGTITAWASPVPNAFSVAGSAANGAMGQRALSWVLTNPNQPCRLSMPQSFVKIHVDTMYSKWFFFPTGYPPLELDPEQSYDYTPDSQSNFPMLGGGIACSSVTPDNAEVGLEVVGQPLDGIIFGTPQGNYSGLEQEMVSRINEMVSGISLTSPLHTFSAADLHSCLSDPATTGWLLEGTQDFYLFSPDGQSLTVQPQATAVAMAPWMTNIIGNTPDGTEVKLVDDTSQVTPDILFPEVSPDPFCSVIVDLGWSTWDKDLNWTAGTGYNGCLGQVRVTRWTDVYSLGVCG